MTQNVIVHVHPGTDMVLDRRILEYITNEATTEDLLALSKLVDEVLKNNAVNVTVYP
jgi:hypothetical protein